VKVKVGDKVRFLNDVGGGKVVKIKDSRMVVIETDDGFEMPVLSNELVVIDNASDFRISQTSDKNNNAQNVSKPTLQKVHSTTDDIIEGEDISGSEVALSMAFVPDNINDLQSSSFKLYVINDSSYRVFYTLSLWNENLLNPIKSGVLTSETKEFVKEFTISDINETKVLNLQAVYFKNIAFNAYKPEFFDFELNPVKLMKKGNFSENDFFDEKAYVISISDTEREELLQQITDEAIEKVIKQKESFVPAKKQVKKSDTSPEEVDLHIQELIDDWQNMTPGEIIQIQLARFETALEGGLRSNTRKMVFIHGVGNGKLKYEIYKILDKKYPSLKYQDASFKEYGYGATLVMLK